MARQVGSNLNEKGPLSRRELVRCFNNQRWERFAPVIGALIALGVLVGQEDEKFAVGEVDLSEVEDQLRQSLLAPIPATTGVKNVNDPKPPAKTRPRAQPKKQTKRKQGE